MAEDTVLMGRGRVATCLGALRSQLGICAKATVGNCFLAHALHYPKVPSFPNLPGGVRRGHSELVAIAHPDAWKLRWEHKVKIF